MKKICILLVLLSMSAGPTLAQVYDGFFVFRPPNSIIAPQISHFDKFAIDNGIVLPDGRHVPSGSLGVFGNDGGNIGYGDNMELFFVPENPALGVSIVNSEGGDDTFICCWWYFPEE